MKSENLMKIIEMMNIKISHLEDIEADNRELLIKVIKQGNQIVEFLKGCEVQIEEEYDNVSFIEDEDKLKKLETVKELVNQFIERKEELKEFEKELQKYKSEITPGIIGES